MPDQNPSIPETPLKVFAREPRQGGSNFYVRVPDLASDDEKDHIADEEIKALAHIIYNAYLEWKQQLPISVSRASDKSTKEVR